MVKRIFVLTTFLLLLAPFALAKKDSCTSIKDGVLTYSDSDDLIPLGFDVWGYNYQSHLFKGGYCDAYHDAEWCQEWRDTELMMKWNDAWLSNKDCDGDGLLDRHFGYDSYVGSGAWLTNHMWEPDGSYYFVKIVAKPFQGYECEQEIWGSFCVMQEVYGGEGATIYETPGFGKY